MEQLPIPSIRSISSRSTPLSDEGSQILTLTQAAKYLRISKAHLAAVIAGKVPSVPSLRHARVGRRILIKHQWADEWLETLAQHPRRQW
jgi:excisionase family DNA binding protein